MIEIYIWKSQEEYEFPKNVNTNWTQMQDFQN